MKKLTTWLAWVTVGLVAVLAALNWPTMIATAPLNLVVTEVHLPLGLLMLALAAVPLALFFVAYLHQQITALVETRRLLREVQRAHELADTAEASRVEGLRQLLAQEFRVINERLDSLGAALPASIATPTGNPTGLRRILTAPWRSDDVKSP
jgi:uncharacterized membrane protein